MKPRVFKIGPHSVKFVHSDKYGFVTTTSALAKACGVSRVKLKAICEFENLVENEGVIEDEGLASLVEKSARKDNYMWTVGATVFLSTYLNTKASTRFRTKVLEKLPKPDVEKPLTKFDLLCRITWLESNIEILETIIQNQQTIIETQEEMLKALEKVVGPKIRNVRVKLPRTELHTSPK